MAPMSRKIRWQRGLMDSELPSRARLVGFALSVYARPDGAMDRHPSIHHLAKATSTQRLTVRRALDDLQQDRWIADVGVDNWGTTCWWLTIPPTSTWHEGGHSVTQGGVTQSPPSDHSVTPHPSGTGFTSPTPALANIIDLTSHALRIPK